MKRFLKNKCIGFYYSLVALIFAALGLVAYITTMKQQENMVMPVVVITLVGILVGIIICLFDDYLRLLTILAADMYLLAGLLFLTTQAENIGYALFNVKIGDGILPSFVIGMVFYGIATVTSIIAACVRHKKDMIIVESN